MKYETEILEAFKICGFSPRDGQVKNCNEVLIGYLDEGFKTIVLSAPTGVGKSILGAVIAEVLERKKGKNGLCSFMLMGQNVLAQQYMNTFVNKPNVSTGTFVFLKGAGNFPCTALSASGEPTTAENCALSLFRENDMVDEMAQHCNRCEYQRIKKQKNICRNLITNYSYFFIDRLYLAQSDFGMLPRTITIFDEAQTLNDLFVEHNSIFFSLKRLKGYHEEIAEHLPLGNSTIFRDLKKMMDDLQAGKINDNNYMQYLKVLYSIYKTASVCAEKEAKSNIRNPKEYNKYTRLKNKYFGLGCKIDDLLKFQYDNIFEYKKKEQEATVKAIFCGDMFYELINSDYLLFMSATITKEYLVETLALDPKLIKFVSLAPTFPKESKKVIFWSPMSLNYKTLQDDKVVSTLQTRVEKIVNKHSSVGEKGIVLTPSFDLTRKICDKLVWTKDYEVFEHRAGEKLAVILHDFKEYTKGPAVLVSPSLFEGISLDDEISRYQVFVKAPYPSLGDKRMKHILDFYPKIYEFITLLKVIQGCGRSTRSAEDYSVTYMLDTNLQRLWKSQQNIWSEEFLVTFNSMLGD
jgi:ATP-dependent DNA helicase DinG